MTTDPHAGAELTDDALHDEIELVGDLVVAASASERPLTDDEIDRVLGIERGQCAGPVSSAEHAHRSWKRLNV